MWDGLIIFILTIKNRHANLSGMIEILNINNKVENNSKSLVTYQAKCIFHKDSDPLEL